MKVDYHIHSNFSFDSKEEPENIIKHAIQNNFDEIVFTDHLDIDFPDNKVEVLLDIDLYIETLTLLKEKYKDSINIKIGLEVGMQPHLKDDEFMNKVLNEKRFDFIIGSNHCSDYTDIASKRYFQKFKTKDEAHRNYFENLLRDVKTFKGISVIGHFDFIKRYGKAIHSDFNTMNYDLHKDIIEEILIHLVNNDIGIEVNTSGYRYNLGETNASEYILKEYHRLGGKIVTVGSDSHKKENLGGYFDIAYNLLKKCGFNHIATFNKKQVSYIEI